MISKYFIAVLIGAGLLACSSVNTITVDAEQVEVTDEFAITNLIDSIVAPYKQEMDAQMDSVISYSANDFTKGRPGGSLNNWSADAIFWHQAVFGDFEVNEPVFCLLNVGGLRNPISKGDVTIGDIYKLMPFDNEIVWVQMPLSSILDIEQYLEKTGGEPISGATIDGGKLKFDKINKNTESYWIITSDYLMNGGDKMTFFEKRISVEYPETLMRDAMIDIAKSQDTLSWNNDSRINF